jgi:hypothetical protein
LEIEVCAHCSTAVKSIEKSLYCMLCGETLTVRTYEEVEFFPLLLVIDIKKQLRLNQSYLCRMYFRNLDCEEIRNIAVKVSSKVLHEEWTDTISCITRGMSEVARARAELYPERPGDMALHFTIEFMDPRGAFRTYKGDVELEVAPPESQSQSANVTVNITASKAMGIDLSELVKFKDANLQAASAPEGYHRIPVALHLDKFKPGKRQPSPQSDAAPAAKLERARLVFEAAERGRKTILLTKSAITMGRRKQSQDSRVNLTLRVLPSAENERANRAISKRHAHIQARGDHFEVQDDPESMNGAFLISLTGGEGADGLSIGDEETALQTGVRPGDAPIVKTPEPAEVEGPMTDLPKGQWVALPERCEISIGKRLLVLRAFTFTSRDRGLYALRLQRVDNHPELEYVVIAKRAYIGSMTKCPIRVRDEKFPALAAALDYEEGQFTLFAFSENPPVCLNGKTVPSKSAVKLPRPSRITIGDYVWCFDQATDDDFTKI